MMKKRVLTGILAGVLALTALVGCGGTGAEANANSGANAAADAAGAAGGTEVGAAAGGAASKGKITVAASATPHAEILEQAKTILAEQGWDLQVTVFDDYILPNEVVESGEFDANYFQHIPYLENFNAEKGHT